MAPLRRPSTEAALPLRRLSASTETAKPFRALFEKDDPRDTRDSVKWDFDDSQMEGKIGADGYYYKLVVDTTQPYNKINKLEQVRAKAANIAHYFHVNLNKYDLSSKDKRFAYPAEVKHGLRLFIHIHGEIPIDQSRIVEMSPKQLELMRLHWSLNGTCSNVIYSEMPLSSPFKGLNKPMERYINEHAPLIGKDENLRSKWRHVFLKISNDYKTLDQDIPLTNLVIHELAHTAANHQQWRNDDHGEDFKLYENIIREAWRSV